jgi:hypothetical protein
VTSQPHSYPDPSNPVTAQVTTSARPLTEPMRELAVFALLAGNGVFLALGISGLFFVIDGWVSNFGLRCANVYLDFTGPLALGLPVLAMLLTTHVAPILRRARGILITVFAELCVSAVFGAVTYLGAFAHGLDSVRDTIEGLLYRSVWLGFLVLVCIMLARIWRGLYPPPKARPAGFPAYPQMTYGRPYPGQPLYPQGTYQPGTDEYLDSVDPFAETGWPVVPPPPRPAPLLVEPAGEQTMRFSPLVPEQPAPAPEASNGTGPIAADTGQDPAGH